METEKTNPEAPQQPHEEGIRVTKAEFIVLDKYVRNEDMGSYDTMPIMAKECGINRATFDKVMARIKERNWVSGTRKIETTEVGREAHKKMVSFLADQQQRVNQTPQAQPVPDASAAAMTQAPANVSSDQRYESSAPARPPVRREKGQQETLSESLASRLRVKPDDVFEVIRNNVISVGRNESKPTNAEVMQVMSVMLKYELDPFVKQVHAFRHRGKLQITVGNDGWTAIANRQPRFEGVEYEFPDEMVETPDGKQCWPWVKAVCYVTGRVPTVKYAFLEEWYIATKPSDNSPSNWSQYPCHRLQGKAYNLVVKEAFGISLHDSADAEQFEQMAYADATIVDDAMNNRVSNMTSMLVEGTKEVDNDGAH